MTSPTWSDNGPSDAPIDETHAMRVSFCHTQFPGSAIAIPHTQPTMVSFNSVIVAISNLFFSNKSWLKCSNITSIFKKRLGSKAENYLPISLTSHILKITESIIQEAIVDHLEKYKLLHDSTRNMASEKYDHA